MANEFRIKNGFRSEGNSEVTGSLNVSSGITASLQGTASWAENATTASYVQTAQTASYILQSVSSSFALTASYIENAVSSSFATTASFYQETDPLFIAKSGSFATTGSNLFIGTQQFSGSLQLNPTQDPGGSNTTSSFLFVTSSGDNTEYNLHYRNNGALWETHWLEERVDTGIVWGGVLTFTNTTMSITPGAGLIVNHNTNTGSHGDTIPTYVQFGPITASATFITSSQVTYLLIDENGNLIQQTSPFTPQQYNEKLPLGYIFSLTTSSISSYADARVTTYGQDEQQSQFIRAFGPLKVSGYDLTAQSGSLKISIAAGRTYRNGGFYTQDPDNPSVYNSTAVATGSLVRIYRDPAVVGGFRAATNAGVPYTDIDPTKWDNGSGTLQTVGASEWSIQRIFQGVVNNISYVYYGQNVYDSLNAAIQSITTEPFEESQTSIIALPFIGYIIARGNTTDIGDTTNNKLINSGLFRNTAGSSGGGGVATTNLNDLADVVITSPTNGTALIYNAGQWINGTPLNTTSASYADTASYVLQSVSASYASTASYTQTSQTASYVLNAVSSSFATTASYVIGGGAGTPGGLDTEIQYNSGGAFAATASFAFIYASQSLQQGFTVTAAGQYSHAEGANTIAQGQYSHAEGRDSNAGGAYSHAEGFQTQTKNTANYSHAEGRTTTANGTYSHAEGRESNSNGDSSHAEGYKSISAGEYSHAEGRETQANANGSHTEGYLTEIEKNATYSHAEGIGTVASGSGQHVSGKYNKHGDTTSLVIIGNGTSNATRSDIFRVTPTDVHVTGSFIVHNTSSDLPLLSAHTGSGVTVYDTLGTSSIDAETRIAYDSTAIQSVDWNNRSLKDGGIVDSVMWASRALLESAGNYSFSWDATNQNNTIKFNYLSITEISSLDNFSQYSTNAAAPNLTQNLSGEVIRTPNIVDAAVNIGNLVYLNSDGIWYKTDQMSLSSSYMLGICTENQLTKEQVFLEGNIGFTTSSIAGSPYVSGSNFYGVPIYISGSDGAMSTQKPTSGVVRVVGHAFYNSTTTPTNWLMKFRPSNDWYEI